MTEKLLFDAISRSSSDTESLGAQLAELMCREKDIPAFIALYGDLGAGKTAFVRGFASVMSPGSAVRSPTYAIVNEYARGELPLFHFDMYRINDDDELYSSGFYDYEGRGGICLVEWCENIPWALPRERVETRINKSENVDERTISIKLIREKEQV